MNSRSMAADTHIAAGAVESQDPWAVATFQWLLARPDQALRSLLHAEQPPAATLQLSSPLTATLPPELLLLDFMFQASASGAAVLPLGEAGTLRALRAQAQRSVSALSTRGLPGVALEALCLAEAWSQHAGEHESSAEQGTGCGIMQSWKADLAAAAMLRDLLGAPSLFPQVQFESAAAKAKYRLRAVVSYLRWGPLADGGMQRRSWDGGGGWKAAARQGITSVQARGVNVQEEPVLACLSELLAGLLAPPPLARPGGGAPDQELPVTPFSDISSSRVSFSQERRCGAPFHPFVASTVLSNFPVPTVWTTHGRNTVNS